MNDTPTNSRSAWRPGNGNPGEAFNDETIEEAWERFADFLRDSGARLTQARRIVFSRVMARPDHFRADDLAAELSTGANRVSRATVYHTLALMVKLGFVHTLRDVDKHAHYERAYGQQRHEHMICDQCGTFIEFDASEVVDFIRAKCAEYGFVKRTSRIAVFGLCRECAERAKK